MKSIASVFTVILLVAGNAAAQQRMEPFEAFESAHQEGPAAHWCATPYFMSTPEGRAALQSYHVARRDGRLRVSKGEQTYEIGQSAAFNIISDTAWTSAEFELRITGNKWRAWLRTEQVATLKA